MTQDIKGLAGVVYPDAFQMNQRVSPMLEALHHRGHGASDIYKHKNIEIGIGGGGFSCNEKKSIYLGIDGTIYNCDVLNQDLKSQGYHTKGIPCGQTLVYAYEVWGLSFLQKLTGDFAIVVLDQAEQQLILARDRMGKKPLYWYQDNEYLLFASELKALLATGIVPQTAGPDALASYLYFGYIPQDMSPIQGVNKLLPSHSLVSHFDGRIHIDSYWSYSSFFEQEARPTNEDLLEKFDALMQASVSVRTPQDKKSGCFILGGLGSASVAHYASQYTDPGTLSAYTVGFQGENTADVRAAEEVASALGLPHREQWLTPENFLKDFVSMMWHLDEPIADPNVIATWKLAQMASEEVQVVLSGMGSDELLAGHGRYTFEEQHLSPFVKYSQKPLSLLRRLLIPIARYVHTPWAYELSKDSRKNPWQLEYLQKNSVFDEKALEKASPKLCGRFDPEVFLHKFHHLPDVHSTISGYLYFDVKTRLADCYTLQYERSTAAFALDWKTPFLDRHIVEFLASIPAPEYLVESETAAFLKRLLKGVYPDSFVNRPKKTRRHFLSSWLSHNAFTELFPLLAKGTLVESGLISKGWINDQINRLGDDSASLRHLWAILVLEVWFRLYINHPVGVSPPDLTVYELLSER